MMIYIWKRTQIKKFFTCTLLRTENCANFSNFFLYFQPFGNICSDIRKRTANIKTSKLSQRWPLRKRDRFYLFKSLYELAWSVWNEFKRNSFKKDSMEETEFLLYPKRTQNCRCKSKFFKNIFPKNIFRGMRWKENSFHN